MLKFRWYGAERETENKKQQQIGEREKRENKKLVEKKIY